MELEGYELKVKQDYKVFEFISAHKGWLNFEKGLDYKAFLLHSKLN